MRKLHITILFFFISTMLISQNRSLDFDGSDDRVFLSNADEFKLARGTIEAWIKTSNAGSGYSAIIVKQNAYGLFLRDNELGIFDWGGSGDWKGTGQYPNDGAWHHVALTFLSEGANGARIYLDGALVLTTTMKVLDQSNPVLIGQGGFTETPEMVTIPIQNFSGYIDEVRIWEVRRNQGLIQNNSNTELTGTESNLVAYYKMDDPNSLCDVIDCGPNEQHGQRQGTGGVNNLPQFSTDVPSITDVACGAMINCAPLPVELVDFSGAVHGNQVRLFWITASELDNAGFQVQRSREGTDWQDLEFVNGMGTSFELNQYEYLDKNPYSGINYYRLKQIDFDGAYEYSKVISLDFDPGKNDAFQIYPNPAKDRLRIRGIEEGLVMIYDNSGKMIRQVRYTGSGMDISDLASGLYFLQITSGNKRITKKFFKG